MHFKNRRKNDKLQMDHLCYAIFFATTVNYLDRQVLSLTWDEFIKPEFHWNEVHLQHGTITFLVSPLHTLLVCVCRTFCRIGGKPSSNRKAVQCYSAESQLMLVCTAARTAATCR